MKILTIEIPEPGDGRCEFDVVDANGRRCGGLTWDEMFGQVARLTIIEPRSKCGGLYNMHTPEEWEQQREDRRERMKAPATRA